MEIVKSTTRLVFIFRHFVIKLPLINWKEIVRGCKSSIIEIKKQGFKKYYQKKRREKIRWLISNKQEALEISEKLGLDIPFYRGYEVRGTFSEFLLAGIMTNWNEYRFYRRTKNPFLMPSYFSLFGLFNIQRKAEKITFWTSDGLWLYICSNMERPKQVFCDSHTFAQLKNFGLDGDHLKILDYGNRRAHSFLEVNGHNLFNNFVRPYYWKEFA